MKGEISLRLSGIGKSFGGQRILDDVTLEAARGEFIALVGPSGCGKTTLLRIAAGLEHPDEGGVELDGRDVTGLRPADRDIAMVFQSYALYPHLTAFQNMAVPLALRRLTTAQRLPFVGGWLPGAAAARAGIAGAVNEAARILKIEALLGRKPGQMSGGQRQRVALGRALVRQPRAFLMDEPLSNLDANLRVHTRTEIVDLHRRVGVTTLYVTHDQTEALSMADRVAVMIGGRLLQLAPPEEVYRDPQHIEVATFIGSPRINLHETRVEVGGRALIGRAVVVPGGIERPEGSAITLGIRPEAIDIRPPGGGIPAKVRRIEFLGSELLVHVQADKAVMVVKLAPEALPPNCGEGSAVALLPHPGAVLLFDADGRRIPLPPETAETLPMVRAAHG